MNDKEKVKKVKRIASAVDSGQDLCDAAKLFGITPTTYLRWKRVFVERTQTR